MYFGPVVMSGMLVVLIYEFPIARLRLRGMSGPTSHVAFQVYCGYIHDTVPVLRWM